MVKTTILFFGWFSRYISWFSRGSWDVCFASIWHPCWIPLMFLGIKLTIQIIRCGWNYQYYIYKTCPWPLAQNHFLWHCGAVKRGYFLSKIASTKPQFQSTADHHIAISQLLQAIYSYYNRESNVHANWLSDLGRNVELFFVIPHDFNAKNDEAGLQYRYPRW